MKRFLFVFLLYGIYFAYLEVSEFQKFRYGLKEGWCDEQREPFSTIDESVPVRQGSNIERWMLNEQSVKKRFYESNLLKANYFNMAIPDVNYVGNRNNNTIVDKITFPNSFDIQTIEIGRLEGFEVVINDFELQDSWDEGIGFKTEIISLPNSLIKSNSSSVFSYFSPENKDWGFSDINTDKKEIHYKDKLKKVEIGGDIWIRACIFKIN